jgi:hypothetical protein
MSLSKRYYEAQAEREQPTTRLERSRASLRNAARHVEVSEGRLLDYGTADEIQRALHTAARELEALTITLSVMQRVEATR